VWLCSQLRPLTALLVLLSCSLLALSDLPFASCRCFVIRYRVLTILGMIIPTASHFSLLASRFWVVLQGRRGAC
jgi:hypothetical protein